MNKFVVLPKMKFNRWTVIQRVKNASRVSYLCRCDCGKERIVLLQNLKNGRSRSCGCYSSEIHAEVMRKTFTIHGFRSGRMMKRIYRIWQDMRRRCSKENRIGFVNYGGRGISVCSEWDIYVLL